jgi:hypothetical protein
MDFVLKVNVVMKKIFKFFIKGIKMEKLKLYNIIKVIQSL